MKIAVEFKPVKYVKCQVVTPETIQGKLDHLESVLLRK